MDKFLAKVGLEVDVSFVKLHVGTDDLDELVEFIWDKNDLSPLVAAGLKPLLRNKLFRAIFQEKAARDNRTVLPLQVDREPTGKCTPTSASLPEIESNGVSLDEVQDDVSSLSEVSQESTQAEVSRESTKAPSNLEVSQESTQAEVIQKSTKAPSNLVLCTNVDPTKTASTGGSKSAPDQVDAGNVEVEHFPQLGAAGKRTVVPQAKHTKVAAGSEKVSAYHLDEREQRRAARSESAQAKIAQEAQERAEKDRQAQEDARRQAQESAQQRAQQANRFRQAQAANLRPPQAPPQPVRQPRSGYGRQFGGAYQSMSSAYSGYSRGQPLAGCPRSCTICYPQG